jgi:hypothetical protein
MRRLGRMRKAEGGSGKMDCESEKKKAERSE